MFYVFFIAAMFLLCQRFYFLKTFIEIPSKNIVLSISSSRYTAPRALGIKQEVETFFLIFLERFYIYR